MSDRSAIEWTDASWNPIRARNLKTGKIGWHCEHATTGCINCYAEGMNKRLGTGLPFKPGHRDDIEIFLDEEMLKAPLRWKKPRKVFVGSMTDLFADFVTDAMLERVFETIGECDDLGLEHEFQILTKRASRMRRWISARGYRAWNRLRLGQDAWPAHNIWLGVSCERQEQADERIPLLLQTPAAVRFISAEPLLGAVDLTTLPAPTYPLGLNSLRANADGSKLDWVIVGGESGPHARPMNPQWTRDLRDQCKAAGVAYFFKQWGEFLPVGECLPGFGKVLGATAVKPCRMKLHYAGTPKQAPKHAFADRGVAFTSTADGRLTFRVGKKAAGRLLDGREHNEFPHEVTT